MTAPSRHQVARAPKLLRAATRGSWRQRLGWWWARWRDTWGRYRAPYEIETMTGLYGDQYLRVHGHEYGDRARLNWADATAFVERVLAAPPGQPFAMRVVADGGPAAGEPAGYLVVPGHWVPALQRQCEALAASLCAIVALASAEPAAPPKPTPAKAKPAPKPN